MPAGALDAELSEDFAWSNFDGLTQCTNVAEIEHAYRMFELEEARLDVEISESVEATADVDNSFAQLFDLQAALHAISDQLEPVQSAIDTTATNAGAISGRVRFLDQEQKKLKQALSMIAETALLKHRLVELLAAMRDKNIDIAAALIHKYITTDAPILDSPFVAFASANGSSEGSSSPRSIIASATRELVDRVSFTFDAAVESNNTKEISHCFRLFPLLGEDLRGLDMYSDFLCKMIAEKSRVTADIQGPSIYAVRLTRLFEVIAVIIDNHFPLVETHYGPGRMIRVIQRLQMEGTKRAAMVLDFFEDERHIKRRIAQIQQADASQPRSKSYAMAAADHRSKSEDALSDHDFKDITDILGELYLQKTADELKTRVTGEWARIPQQDHVTRAQKALDAFGAFLAKFTHAKQRSLEQFGAQVIKPWVRAILQQSYRDIKYVLTDEEFNDVQNDNLFQKRFVLKFGLLAKQLKERLTASNLAAALDIAASSLAVDWERAIRQSKFNMLGGIMFEKDVREIQRYLELESDTMLRKKFLRLIQSASVLAVEGVADAKHIFDGLSVADASPQAALSKSEVKAILANRIDVSEKDISELEP
ncbi:Golgi transport complex subunit 4 [Coemansia linderi]|uniref:Golgi transport complex subunit 4 n=1 Tax=Coemansia linderi TaxID=2663919 RepID=A0ACC1KGA6_9FUNG|nr:Golgi transport complex subunit 4 [Coemansia linderi]